MSVMSAEEKTIKTEISTKPEIRRSIREKRALLSANWVIRESRCVQQRAVTLAEYVSAQAVGVYYAMPDEVQTAELLDCCWREGKEVYVPAFDSTQNAYIFAKTHAGVALKKGTLDIPEPVTRAVAEADALTIAFVPGLAFDVLGGRLGHGAGHYDALLRDHVRAFKIGLAFDFQIADRIPMTSDDVAINAVVTNTKIIHVDDNENGSTR